MLEAMAGLAASRALANPAETALLGRQLALRAVGATEADLQHTASNGIPPVVLVSVSLVIGAIVAVRYLPERWQTNIRRFGR